LNRKTRHQQAATVGSGAKIGKEPEPFFSHVFVVDALLPALPRPRTQVRARVFYFRRDKDMSALETMIANLTKDGYTVRIRETDGLYLVSVHKGKSVESYGESHILVEAMEDAYARAPEKAGEK
jgi:hypothetical protein